MDELGTEYYDLEMQKAELEREMQILNNEYELRIEKDEKLSLFYENELSEWLTRINKEKIIWKKQRDNLSEKCFKLQNCLQNKYSSTNTNLEKEKEKYFNIITKLLPEYQKLIEENQIKEISKYESKVSLIQERREKADIAFEKEKKILSLISIRQKQLQQLQNEEKKDALIREFERKTIIENEINYNNSLKMNEKDTFVDMRLQQHILRKQITSELEKKFIDEINHMKTKLLTPKNDENIEPNNATIDTTINMNDTNKSTSQYTEEQYIFDDDNIIQNDDNQKINNVANEEQKHFDDEQKSPNNDEQESKHKSNNVQTNIRTVNDFEDEEPINNGNIKDEEGNETEIINEEFNAEENNENKLDSSKSNANTIFSVHSNQNINSSIDVDIDSHNDNDDTSEIEKAVGLIEINNDAIKLEDDEQEKKDNISIKSIPIIANENVESKTHISPKHIKSEQNENSEQKSKIQTRSKLKRSFNARTSKNRLQFLSVLDSPNKNTNNEEESKLKSNNVRTNIKTVNDFEDEKPINIANKIIENNNSDDEFDF